MKTHQFKYRKTKAFYLGFYILLAMGYLVFDIMVFSEESLFLHWIFLIAAIFLIVYLFPEMLVLLWDKSIQLQLSPDHFGYKKKGEWIEIYWWQVKAINFNRRYQEGSWGGDIDSKLTVKVQSSNTENIETHIIQLENLNEKSYLIYDLFTKKIELGKFE